MVEGVQQGPVLVGTFFKATALVDLPQPTTADGTPYPGSEEGVCRLH